MKKLNSLIKRKFSNFSPKISKKKNEIQLEINKFP